MRIKKPEVKNLMGIRKVTIVIISISMILAMGVNYMAENDRYDETGIYSGISLFGPYGEGHAAFVRNNEVNAGEIHVLGWGGIEVQEGVYDWSLVDDYLKYYENSGKRAAIRIQSAGHSTWETPRWLYEDYKVRQITGQGVFLDFSENEPSEQRSAKEFSSGRSEYLTTLVGGTKNDGVLVCETPGETVIESTHHLNAYETQIGFDYMGTGTISIVIERGGQETVFNSFEAQQDRQSAMFRIPGSEFDYNSIIKFVVQEPGIVLDNVSISANAEGFHNHDINLSFPNYFDPVYIEKYTNFVKAFAERYRDNPHVGAVVVGGFGRWDELSMLGEERAEFELQTKQWRAYGYYDNKFIEHVDGMCKLFKEEFGDHKEIILHIAAFSLPATGLGDGAGDANYVGYAVNNLAKKYGFTAKLNGLTEKMSEWGQAQNGFNFFANRYKYNTDTKHILETALQVNNPRAYWTGHPISLYNRVMIDQVDNLWHYSADLRLPFVTKYAHVMNEQAGNALFTRSYNILMRTFFKADATNWDGSTDDRVLRNIWNGLYLMNERSPAIESGNDEHKNNYDFIIDREVIKTSERFPVIRFSLDDRQSYNVMYGTTFAVEYYDTGTDTFDIILQGEEETVTLGTVTKTDTREFKTAYFHAGDFFDTANNGDKPDILYEVSIDDNADGYEYISAIEMNYVASIDWKEEKTYEAYTGDEPQLKRLAAREDPVILEIEKEGPLSSLEMHIGTDYRGYVLMEAEVWGVENGEKTLITRKEHFMPGEYDFLRLPVAKANCDTLSFEVHIRCLRGEGYVYMDDSGGYAYSTYRYTENKNANGNVIDSTGEFAALLPFFGMKIPSGVESETTIEKKLGDEWIQVSSFSGNEEAGEVTFEPQTAGWYRIVNKDTDVSKFSVLYLERRSKANPPTRHNLGTKLNENFKNVADSTEEFWVPSDGFTNTGKKDGIWSGEVASPNPYIETGVKLSVEPSVSQIFHFVIKNETASDMVKIYWMNEGDDEYSEEKVAYVPVVPNDTKFREYSWPIGQEASRYNFVGALGGIMNRSTFTYADENLGNITGFKVVPVTGHTVLGGRVSIAGMALREDNTVEYSFREPLDIGDIVGSEMTVAVGSSKSLFPFKSPITYILVAAVLAVTGFAAVFVLKKRKKTKLTDKG